MLAQFETETFSDWMRDASVVLTRYGRDARSVFDLLGHDEVDLTAALGWTLEHSPTFADLLWERLDMPGRTDDLGISLEVADAEGRTDLELRTPTATVIVEAKKGWLLPGETQLARYVGRFTPGLTSLVVSLSDSSSHAAALELPESVAGIPVRHLPWDDVRADLRAALSTTRGGRERHWLQELTTYLAGATSVRDPAEQWVYVVSVSPDRPEGSPFTFQEFVRDERTYFHPFGKMWPKRPPVFMGFRWNGRLQQVNRVTSSEVISSLPSKWPTMEANEDTDRPYWLYTLGPDIPVPALQTSGLWSRRLWALLDQILTQPTLVEAERASKALTQQAL